MLNLRCIEIKSVAKNVTLTFKRYKNPPHHWSMLRKDVTPAGKALNHLDEFYGPYFGERWKDIKNAITRPNKYVALVNNYGDDAETMDHLEKIGALNLKDVFEDNKEKLKNKPLRQPKIIPKDISDIDNKIAEIAQQLSQEEINELYNQPVDMAPPAAIDTGGTIVGQVEDTEQDKLIANSENSIITSEEMKHYEENRVIDADIGLSSVALWNFVPATKLKGKDDWLPESLQFQYYMNSKDFPVTTEEDENFAIPQLLNIYSFDIGNTKKFFPPKVCNTGVSNYFLLDGASVLPVIALDPQMGDRVLDMCASPGGKTLLLLQTMLPDSVTANDLQISRINRIKKILGEYLFDYSTNPKWKDMIKITQNDGRYMEDFLGFDRILVDAPCTTDRHSVRESFNNIFKMTRLKERLQLPGVQSDLLCNALKLCKVGGRVVYSTCTLSPLQNDGAVQMALKKANEEHEIEATVKLFTNSILPLRGMFQLGEGSLAPKFGHLVVPHIKSNFGPCYFSTIVRTK